MDSQLAQLEIKHHITRWKETDPEYISAKADDSRSSLRATIVKRQYLLRLNAGGELVVMLALTFAIRWAKKLPDDSAVG